MYDGGRRHRAVRLDNQVRKEVLIEVIQGGRNPERAQIGMDVVRKIQAGRTNDREQMLAPVTIARI